MSFLAKVSSNESIVAVIVMGSSVRERGHRRSDLDLLVVYRGIRPAIDAPLEVDIRFHAIDRVDEQVAKGHEVLCWAIKFGTALYDLEGMWERLRESWSERVPLPSAKQARERGRQTMTRAREMVSIGDESAADDLILAALTQFVRQQLIENDVFPASRPELPNQLRKIRRNDALAQLLDDAMYGDLAPENLLDRYDALTPWPRMAGRT